MSFIVKVSSPEKLAIIPIFKVLLFIYKNIESARITIIKEKK
ncbi:hypothetical protein [Marinitoga lauensis]|nr:hypothetical protein [Marinitoga lauensis]